MNLFSQFKKGSATKSTNEQAKDLYRPKPSWAYELTDEEWEKAIEGMPKGKLKVRYFCSKDLPF